MKFFSVFFLIFVSATGDAMVFKKLPRSVKVNKKTYAIRYTDEIEKGKLAGLCDHIAKKIDVLIEERTESESTVIHEILHAISYEYNFDLSENKVLQLETAIYSVFRANGWTINLRKQVRKSKNKSR